MKPSPLQRYALRLLFAAGQCKPMELRQWRNLQRSDAEALLTSRGGAQAVLRNTVLPRAAEVGGKPRTASDFPAQPFAPRGKDSEMEL